MLGVVNPPSSSLGRGGPFCKRELEEILKDSKGGTDEKDNIVLCPAAIVHYTLSVL
jgi:hypothetical protein